MTKINSEYKDHEAYGKFIFISISKSRSKSKPKVEMLQTTAAIRQGLLLVKVV